MECDPYPGYTLIKECLATYIRRMGNLIKLKDYKDEEIFHPDSELMKDTVYFMEMKYEYLRDKRGDAFFCLISDRLDKSTFTRLMSNDKKLKIAISSWYKFNKAIFEKLAVSDVFYHLMLVDVSMQLGAITYSSLTSKHSNDTWKDSDYKRSRIA